MRARNYRSGGGADVAAARLDGGAAVAAQRAIFDLVTGYRQIQQGAGFHGEFAFAPAAIDQRAGGHHASASFLDNLNRLQRGAAGGPHVFNHQNVLIRAQCKSAAQTHDSGGIAFGENGGDSAAAGAPLLWARPRRPPAARGCNGGGRVVACEIRAAGVAPDTALRSTIW